MAGYSGKTVVRASERTTEGEEHAYQGKEERGRGRCPFRYAD
jgi:hypothetical protein